MSNLVLYRKYRPKTFAEVVGQEHIVKTLTNALKEGIVSHGYLFCGPHGCGKTTVARLMAKALNCQNRKAGQYEPCNKCDSCLEINHGNAIDLIEIDAATATGVDNIRDLQDGIRFVPTKSEYKVFIFDECLTDDHLIAMGNGDAKRISEIKNGDEIVSINLETGQTINAIVSNWFKRKSDKLIKIRTPQATLKCTPSHRLWVFRNSSFLLTEAKNIQLGDFLLSPIFLPHVQKNSLTPCQLSLLALIQCDGHISKDSITTQIEIRKDQDYFVKTALSGFRAWDIREKPSIKTTLRGTKLIRIYSENLQQKLVKLGCPKGKKGTTIDIPKEVFQAPLESIKAYIDTCFCCEGDIIPFGRPGNINYRLNFTSTSEVFAKKFQFLLKKFRIGSNFLEIKRKSSKHNNLYRISLSGYNLRLFAQQIGLSLARKNKLLRLHLTKKEKQDRIPVEKLVLKERKKMNLPYSRLAPLGIYPASGRPSMSRKSLQEFIKLTGTTKFNIFLNYKYEKVKRKEILNKTIDVYDFTVENIHTFVANGICSSNCHQLSKGAANALLKTLEEPPSHAIFILATTEAHKMLPTIASRCQMFYFRKLQMPEIIARLEKILNEEKIAYEKEALNLVALSAAGAMRDAESLLDEVVSFVGQDGKIERKEVEMLLGVADNFAIFKFLGFLQKKQTKEAVEFINNVVFQSVDLKEFAKSLIGFLREILFLKIDAEFQSPLLFGLSKEEKSELKKLASGFSEPEVKQMLEKFTEAENKMKYAAILQLPLELAVVDICAKNQ